MASHKNFQRDRVKNANVQDQFKRPKNQLKKQSASDEFKEKVKDWVTFYRKNIHRFVEHYLGLEMHLYQKIVLYLMNLSTLVVIVACRASAKSFVIAIYSCARAILYPGSKIVIASSTKKQASLIVSEKIKKELIPASPNLDREIKDIKTSANETEVFFHNGSSIIVVPASENARGARGTVMIYEEFRMIKKEIVDSVLSPFLIVRPVPYLKKKEYEHLKEEPIEIFISSAWFKSHWMWDLMKLGIGSYYKTKEALLIGFDYAITLKHNIRTKKQIVKERKKMDTTTFAMEYQNIMIGSSKDAYFPFELINNAQVIKKAFYPRRNIDVANNSKFKTDMPKKKGEIRVITADIAMIVNKDNDNSVFSCIRALPNKNSYERQVVYMESIQGGETEKQAIRIKQLFYDFEADYLVIDLYNAGISVYDALARVLYDEERDVEYEPWICFNDQGTADRTSNKDALPVVYGMKTSNALNAEIHQTVLDCLEREKLKILTNSVKAKDYLDTKKEYTNGTPEKQIEMEMPYVQSDLLLNEMVNLSYEINENSNTFKLVEPRSGTKDRYISMAYGNYFIKQLEKDLNKKVEKKSILDYCLF